MRAALALASLTVCLTLGTALPVSAQKAGMFTPTGTMHTARYFHSATLLNNGMAVIVGGTTGTSFAPGAELYNPVTGTFTVSGSLKTARYAHTATLLNNGMVLIAGGIGGAGYLSSAELYNPTTGTFTPTGSLNTARDSHTATLLENGMVLIAGGFNGSVLLAGAELYNPTTGTFTATGSLHTAREFHTATLLSNGMVLIAAGYGTSGWLSSAELYNPTTATFSVTGSLHTPREGHTATLLDTGLVLVAGGEGSGFNCLSSAELYNSTTGTFAVTGSMSTPRLDHTATLLNNGMVLIAGGDSNPNTPIVLSSAELYNPTAGTFSVTGSLSTARVSHTATLLNNGMVLAAAGANTSGALSSAELYDPTTLVPAGLLSITLSPAKPWLPIGNAEDFVATGTFSGNVTDTLVSATWSSSNTAVAPVTNDSSNRGHADGLASGTATIEACAGSVCGSTAMTVAPHSNLVIGSMPGDAGSGTFEKYSDTGARLLTGNLAIARALHTATLLQNGTILVAGGTGDTTSCQVLDQNGNVLSSGFLQDGRVSSNAALLGNGNVFLVGGVTGIPTAAPGTWEIHSPTCAMVASGSLNGTRGSGASAVTLLNGNVWISGDEFSSGDACTYEIHNPTGGLVGSGSLESCFAGGQVQVLKNGNVMLLGGDNNPGTWEIRTQTGAFVSTNSLENGFNHGANSVVLNNGNVLIFGSCEIGLNDPDVKDPFDMDLNYNCSVSGATSTCEIRDVNGNFVATASLQDQRDGSDGYSSFTVLSNGNIFITGGNLSPGSWEIRSQTGAFVSSGSLFDARYGGHTTTHF